MVVNSGRVVGIGVNTFRNVPDNMSDNHIISGCTTHAEINALKRAGANARGATVYIARVNSKGHTRFSRPCNNCYKSLVTAGVKTIIYT